jgi:hypothetical protein
MCADAVRRLYRPGPAWTSRLLIANSSPLFRNRYLHRSRGPPPEASLHFAKPLLGDPSHRACFAEAAGHKANQLARSRLQAWRRAVCAAAMIPGEEAEPVDSHVAALRLQRQRQFLTCSHCHSHASMLSQIPIFWHVPTWRSIRRTSGQTARQHRRDRFGQDVWSRSGL